MFVIFFRDEMKINFENFCKRAAALDKKEPTIPTRLIESHKKARPYRTKGSLIPSTNKIETINLTDALSKVRYPAAPAKNWQRYNDTGMGF